MEVEEFSAVEAMFLSALNHGFESGAVFSLLEQLRKYFPSYSDWTPVRELFVGLRQADSLPISWEGFSERDRPFAKSIARLSRPNPAVEVIPEGRIREVGPDLDFLDSTCFMPNLTPVQAINLLLLRRLHPKKNAAIVVTMRDEGLGLLEWVAFYRAIGIPDIFVYSNDNADGSDELLELLATSGVIRLIKNSISPGTNPQRKAYQHALHLLHELRSFRWVLFLDADEFLVLDERYDYRMDHYIRHVEDTFRADLPGGIVFPWDWRLSDLKFEKTDGFLFERYPHSVPHPMVKSMTRLDAALGMCEVHIPTLAKGTILVDSALAPLDAPCVWAAELQSTAGGSIAHFWGKSFEEFAVKKRRGELLSLNDNPLLREFGQYFEWTADLTPDNFHPAPPSLLERSTRAFNELKALPGVANALKTIDSRFGELCRRITIESDLRDLYNKLRTTEGRP